jgi:hypothetical protein
MWRAVFIDADQHFSGKGVGNYTKETSEYQVLELWDDQNKLNPKYTGSGKRRE